MVRLKKKILNYKFDQSFKESCQTNNSEKFYWLFSGKNKAKKLWPAVTNSDFIRLFWFPMRLKSVEICDRWSSFLVFVKNASWIFLFKFFVLILLLSRSKNSYRRSQNFDNIWPMHWHLVLTAMRSKFIHHKSFLILLKLLWMLNFNIVFNLILWWTN